MKRIFAAILAAAAAAVLAVTSAAWVDVTHPYDPDNPEMYPGGYDERVHGSVSDSASESSDDYVDPVPTQVIIQYSTAGTAQETDIFD